MKKTLTNLTIAATVTVSMFASATIPVAVKKHRQNTQSNELTVPATKPISSKADSRGQQFTPPH